MLFLTISVGLHSVPLCATIFFFIRMPITANCTRCARCSTQLKQSQFIQAKSRAFDNNWPWSSLCQSSALLLPMWRISSAQIRSSAILPRMTLSFTLVSKTGNLIAVITYAISNRKLNMVIFPRRSSKRKLVTPFVSFSFILT